MPRCLSRAALDLLYVWREVPLEYPVSRLPVLRVALLAALLALGLSGCGRKGPLDPPPASLAGPQQSAIETDADGRPLAPPGEKKRLPIDFLLD
jgi:predicted small lipoprotein YifL